MNKKDTLDTSNLDITKLEENTDRLMYWTPIQNHQDDSKVHLDSGKDSSSVAITTTRSEEDEKDENKNGFDLKKLYEIITK